MKTTISIFFTIVLMFCAFTSFSQTASKSNEISGIKKGMIKVTIFYPNGEGKKFNVDYYATKHMPMVKSLLGEKVIAYAVDKGLSSEMTNSPAPYLAIGYLYFDSMDAFQNAMSDPISAKKMEADVPNYTNCKPVVQISEVF
jgi:uncharacterized protein (TIGR02118 family)